MSRSSKEWDGQLKGTSDADIEVALHRHHRLSISETLGAGAIAGAFAKTAIAPFDRVKILYQVSQTKQFTLRNAAGDIVYIARNDGVLGLWRGNGVQILRVAPYAGLQYMSFDQFKRRLWDGEMSPLQRFVTGALAGAVSVTLTYPLDLLRARKAVVHGRESPTLLSIIVSIVKKDGPLTLYRGLPASLLGIVPYGGLSFGTFETLKMFFLRHTQEEELSTFLRIVSGATAGLVAQSFTYPLDVVRRRLQVDGFGNCSTKKYTSMTGTAFLILKEEGLVRGLYKGLSMNWIKGPISLGISFTIYDFLTARTIERHN